MERKGVDRLMLASVGALGIMMDDGNTPLHCVTIPVLTTESSVDFNNEAEEPQCGDIMLISGV
eukprot:scaffold4059_cov174-Ochromonas_danica.AAC.8